MLTLYHAPKTRSSRFIWLLEEIGEPYGIQTVSLKGREGHADPANPHPHGKVPAIIHDGETVYESAAIALYLSDAFPKAKLGPPIGDRHRGRYLTWLAYYAGVMEPAFLSKALNFPAATAQMGWANADDVMRVITDALERGPYLLGDNFSTADILYGSSFLLFMGSPLLPETPLLTEYCERLKVRPAWARALAKDNG
jgi:glutathione S-transferase